MGVCIFLLLCRKQEERAIIIHSQRNEHNEIVRYYEMDTLIRGNYRHYDGLGFPNNYHNSFWSNYYSNYWQPSSHYYNEINDPQPIAILPGFYQYYDPLLPTSQVSVNIQDRSRNFYNTMSVYNTHPMFTMERLRLR